MPDSPLDDRDKPWRAGKLTNAKAQEKSCKERIGGHFATDRHGFEMSFGLKERHPDHADHARMRRIVEITHTRAVAINAKRILDEVIGPKRKEIALLG